MRRSLCLILILAAATVSAQTSVPKFRFIPGPKPGGGDIKWSVAEKDGRFEVQKDEYMILERDVRVEYQDIKVAADKVTVNLKTNDVVAEGHVVIDQGPTRVTATQAIYNLNSKTGTFFNATANMDPSMYFSGDRIEKVDEDTYRMTNGVFTSCDLDRPAWSFNVGNADVTLDDYAHMRDIKFRARGLPVFWLPRLIWPTKRDRSQGLLIPRARYVEKFGSRLEMGYFLPFGESVDATIFADVNFQEYFGAGTQIRYVPSENVKIGDLRAHVVNNAALKQIEWKYQYRHAQENLPGGFRGVIDVQDFSNLDFFREYDDDTRLHTLSNIYSSAYLTRNRPKYSLNILADRRDIELLVPDPADTDASDGTDFLTARQRFEQLPSFQLRMYPQRISNTPVYFSMESSASQLRTGGVSPAGERRVDADYFRTDIFPTVALQLRTPPWLSVKPQLSVRQTYYSASMQCPFDEETCGVRELRDDESISRFYAQGQVETVGPSFSRVFNKETGGFSKFKHVIEPRVRYVYTTDVENRDQIVRFDTVDSPFLPLVQNSVEYSLTQRLIGKETGENGNAREVASFSLRQSVALSDPFEQTSFSTGEHRFTPLLASLRVNPYQSVTLDATAAFGNVSHQLDQISVSANLVGTGRMADRYLNFTYFAALNPPGFEDAGDSQIRINTGSPLVKDRIRADVQLNFDPEEGRFLEQRYQVGWTGSCYGISLGIRRYELFGSQFDDDSNRNSFIVAITLKNVGTIGTH
jgi:LPS-assembly protein